VIDELHAARTREVFDALTSSTSSRGIHHAHAILEIKAAEGSARRFSGVATTPATDRAGESIDPLSIRFTNPLPLLLHHDQKQPVGLVWLHAPTVDGIRFTAEIPTVDEPGPLRDLLDTVWQQLKAGLIRGASVGLSMLDRAGNSIRKGRRLIGAEVCELSLVTVPANIHATIDVIKSLDSAFLPAPGPIASGVSDRSIVTDRKGSAIMTTAEKISQFENSRAAKVARMGAIMNDATGESTIPDDKRDEYDGLVLEVKSIDGDLVRFRELEKINAGSAARVESPVRMPVVSIKSNVEPGTAFVRAAMAILATKGSRYEAIEYAKRWEKETPEVGLFLKAAVAPGNTTDPAWAGALVTTQNITSEFIELSRPATILGRIPGFRRVPFNASVPIQTAGGTYGWVGQGKAKPVTALAFGSTKLDISKAAGIIVLTEELVKMSNPAAEGIVRADMIAGIAQFLDSQFIDPAVAAVAGQNPASITNGIAGVASTQNPYEDLHALLSKFAAANVPLRGASLILSETNALAMGFLRDANGNRVFPNISVNGGTVEGFTVVTSNAAGTNVILVQPQAVLYADDGGVSIDVSREASVQMDSAPMSPADATTVLVSLWQNNLVGLRAERFINWKRAVDSGVALVTGAAYPAVATPAATRAA